MFQFIATDIVMIALGALLYLVARSIPRMEESEPGPVKQSFVDRLAHSEIPHKIDAALNLYTGKVCRKLKVVLMRFDNYLTGQIKKINTTRSKAKPKLDFSGIALPDREREEVSVGNGKN